MMHTFLPYLFGLELRLLANKSSEIAKEAYAQAYQKALAGAHVKPDLPAIVEAFGPTPDPIKPAYVEYDPLTGKPLYDINFGALCQPDSVRVSA